VEFDRPFRPADPLQKEEKTMGLVLWLLAVILVVSGIVALVRTQYLWGIMLIVVGLMVGPGGVSIFT
jgi:4-hydroxybenzoate polyprenyltransferase